MAVKKTVDWKGAQVQVAVANIAFTRAGRAAAFLAGEAKKAVNRSQPVKTVGTRRVGLSPSLPGEPPKKVSGFLQRNILSRVIRRGRDVIGQFGVSHVPYGRPLEKGNPKGHLLPRPFLSPQLRRFAQQVKNILATGSP